MTSLAHDYRWDPFSNVSTAINITNEEHTIPSSSPFTISLDEVPQHDSPSTLGIKVKDILAVAIATSGATSITVTNGAWFAIGNTITIDSEQMYVSGIASNVLTVTRGYNSTTATTHSLSTAVYIESSMAEVEATPASGQFWPDYSTGADGQSDWNTGTIVFNSADAGKTIVVSYVATGTLVAIEKMRALHRCVVFTTSDTWMCPEGVDRINVLLIGGGGGGASGGTSMVSGGDGGNSSFGSILTANGGKKGTGSTTDALAGTITTSNASVLIELANFYAGAVGAAGTTSRAGGDATGYGNGGGSGGASGGIGAAGAFPNTKGNHSVLNGSGAGGGCMYAVAVPVTAGNSYNVVVGAGGLGGDGQYDGGDGSPGICIVWY